MVAAPLVHKRSTYQPECAAKLRGRSRQLCVARLRNGTQQCLQSRKTAVTHTETHDIVLTVALGPDTA
jgi:hypothetical protein